MPGLRFVFALSILFAIPISVAAAERPPIVAAPPVPRQTLPQLADAIADGPDRSVIELAEIARDSTVVINVSGRDGERAGMGAGFVISHDGLIATNMHVIGDGRSIEVITSKGRRHDVVEIYATERAMDLAILRIAATGLAPLPLGNSDTLKQGQAVIAVGNPRGFEHSVVEGVVSGSRKIDGKPMIQLAIPIEQGNSGGPLLDRRGRVHGLLTMKSAVTHNLGFAVAANALKPLLAKPNPIPIDRWLTIGAINPAEWNVLLGGRWRQRAGRIVAEGHGQGFGGRTLLISKRSVPKMPFEAAVWVKLKREDGAAGLAFDSDGSVRHFGFYPSNGGLRLTRFEGEDVTSWRILSDSRSSAYRPKEWNRLRLRVEEGAIRCFVNDVPVAETETIDPPTGAIGLASFRDTQAEFRGFEVASKIDPIAAPPAIAAKADRIAADLRSGKATESAAVGEMIRDGAGGTRALQQKADALEDEARRLRNLAAAVRQRAVEEALAALFRDKPEEQVDLLRAALWIAHLDNEDVDVDAYVAEVDRMARDVQTALPAGAKSAARLAAIDDYLFKKMGFHGSRTEFYQQSNSYMNEVIDDREGLPITLSVLYMEIARRLQVPLAGIGLPGRFVVQWQGDSSPAEWIDVYEGARRGSRKELEERIRTDEDEPFTEEHWKPQTKKQIILRMIQNLVSIAQRSGDSAAMLRYVDLRLALDPESVVDHWTRAVICADRRREAEAIAEADWLLKRDDAELAKLVDPSIVRQFRELMKSRLR